MTTFRKRPNFAAMVKTNSFQAWWLAFRPKTLTGAAAPIILALAAAYTVHGHIDWLAAMLCLSFAMLMQIDANLVNDYFDCIRGVDNEERLGPERACSQGWITLPAMRIGIGATTMLACLVGLPLIAWGGWECIAVGMACVLFCFLYTTVFSRIAMGDILVVLFFGLIPVSYTYLFQSHHTSVFDIPQGVWMLALAQGLVTDCLLLVNNLRDHKTDAAVGKTTLVTIIGPVAAIALYFVIGLASVILALCGSWDICQSYSMGNLLPVLFLPLHIFVSVRLRKVFQGRALNKILGMTAMSIFVFSILVSLGLIFQS